MKTKEAIETKKIIRYLKNYVRAIELTGQPECELYLMLKGAVTLLQQGEKFEAIVGELENCLLPEQYKIVEKLLQKYFPKGNK